MLAAVAADSGVLNTDQLSTETLDSLLEKETELKLRIDTLLEEINQLEIKANLKLSDDGKALSKTADEEKDGGG